MPHDHSDPAHAHSVLPSDPALRVKALESLLSAKGLIKPDALDEIIDTYENRIGPRNGAQVVARAWLDEAFRAALMKDATAVVSELGFYGRQGEHMVAVENTPETHNIVVCTLCSCYPWPLLGIPPGWYKSDAYRARVVREPRKVLADFGVVLPAEQAVRVWDSTAEVRYLVIPQRPAGTEGLDEAALMDLVTRDSMIGIHVLWRWFWPVARLANGTLMFHAMRVRRLPRQIMRGFHTMKSGWRGLPIYWLRKGW